MCSRDPENYMNREAKLLIAASETDADMLYVSGVFVPDPFIVIGLNSKWHGLFSPLEIDRAKKTSRLDYVHLLEPWQKKALDKGWKANLAGTAAAFLHGHGITRLTVPAGFALAHADQLRSWNFRVSATSGSLFPERSIKTENEIKHLRRVACITKHAMHQAKIFLASATIGQSDILHHPETGKRLKSAHLRSVIESCLVTHGARPSHTIVSCGRESADPHNIGHGFLYAHQPIIIDIFPRMLSTGYWGDMTRTFVKGKASHELRKLYRTVRMGQNIGLDMVAAGINGADIHQAILAYFDSAGFHTGIKRGKQMGFFHGTGHGLGLDVHEEPRISVQDAQLKAGQVVTIEPGLYYPGFGGIRLEDVVAVREDGSDNLTCYPRRMEIP